MTSTHITQEIFIESDPEIIFEALTRPADLAQWWGDDKTYRCSHWEIDLRVGGQWKASGKNVQDDAFHVGGEFLEVDPPRTLAYTWMPSWQEIPATTVRWMLMPRENGTLVVLSHSGFPNPEVAQEYNNGWPTILGWVRDHVIRKTTPSRAI